MCSRDDENAQNAKTVQFQNPCGNCLILPYLKKRSDHFKIVNYTALGGTLSMHKNFKF